MNGMTDPANERLALPQDYDGSLMARINGIPGGPDAIAAAAVRRDRQAAFYRARPRAWAVVRRLPRPLRPW